MLETSDQIQQHIQRTRADLSENIGELQHKVKSAVDWRVHFNERPLTMIGLAFGAGVLLAAIAPRRNSFNSSTERTSKAWDALKGVVAGVATSRLSKYLDNFVPGFKQTFLKARGNRESAPPPSYDSAQQT